MVPSSLLALTLAVAMAPDPIQAAATAAVRGQLPEARRLLAPLLGANPPDARVFFILACVELEAGDASAAKRDAERLARLAPASPEARVLAVLVGLRSSQPSQRWTDAFIDAVNGARLECPQRQLGKERPDPATARLLPTVTSHEPLTEDFLAKAGPPNGFLLRVAETKDKKALVAEAIAVAGQTAPLATHLLALEVLRSVKTDDATTAAGNLLRRLTKLHPEDMALRLEAALFGSAREAPLSSNEVAQLEEIASSAHFQPSMNRVFEAIREAYLPIDPDGAAEAAFAPSCMGYAFNVTLRPRALATTDNALRTRLSALFASLAGQMRRRATFLDQMFCLGLLNLAVQLHETSTLKMEAEQARARARLLGRKLMLIGFMTEFPIASFRRAFMEDQLTHEVEFLDRLPEVEAACPGSPGPKAW